MLGSGQDKWLLQVKTNRGPSRFYYFFLPLFHLQVLGRLLFVCQMFLHICSILPPPPQLSSGLWIIQNEELKLKWSDGADTSASHVLRAKGGMTTFRSRYLWHQVYVETGRQTCSSTTPSSLFIHSIVDHNKSSDYALSCSKSCIMVFTSAVSPGHLPVHSFRVTVQRFVFMSSNAYYELL